MNIEPYLNVELTENIRDLLTQDYPYVRKEVFADQLNSNKI
jgi:hypothetical protein